MTTLRKFLAAGAVLASAFTYTNSASADVPVVYGEVLADAGTYAPIALNDDLQLDGCNSVFDYNDDPDVVGQTVSLCNGVTDLTNFSFSWKLFQYFSATNSYQSLGFLPATGPLSVVTTGGVGDLIQTAGTYFLRLNITVAPVTTTFALPGGDVGAFNPQDPEFFENGNADPNSDTKSSTFALIVTPASVPEPAAALLLLPAMVVMARRQRKLRKQASC